MDEVVNTVANTAETATPVQESTPVQETTQPTTEKAAVAKETAPVVEDTRFDKNPRFQELNRKAKEGEEAKRKVQEYERRLADLEARNAPKEVNPLDTLPPEEREQTDRFVNQFIKPILKKEFMGEMAPFIQEVQTMKLNKQISEAKELATKVGINFDDRVSEIADYLSRPENKGRLSAKEAFATLYADEIISNSMSRGKDELSRETQALNEKKKIANTSVTNVNPNSVVQTDDLARKGMSPQERLQMDIKKAMELTKQGVKNSKVKIEV